ncbi:unnamed protein product [Meganyctiphanes norvegica]|uniref:Uncharacterized protein n=1 Tax=Meganyctiphanes norvegica TaxID=48144 RepID=A0AAV2PLY1_MEGNR
MKSHRPRTTADFALSAAICIVARAGNFSNILYTTLTLLVAVNHFLGSVRMLPFLSYCCTEQGVQNWSQKKGAYVRTFSTSRTFYFSFSHFLVGIFVDYHWYTCAATKFRPGINKSSKIALTFSN